ncbi:MAG: helix-turn-helix transcriptional regulator [Clostridia bacterium]|nr:helix-turn-helix transcriptional regulator [Clostridia bacterium]
MLRLRDLREDHDLTQAQCAEIANISKNSYIRYENGERATPHDVIIVFSKYYNVTADYILGLIKEPRPLF